MLHERFCSKREVYPGVFEVVTKKWDDGGCQCYNDCDCFKKKGWVGGVIKKYNGFSTLEEAIFKSKIDKLYNALNSILGIEFTDGIKGAGMKSLADGACDIIRELIEEEKKIFKENKLLKTGTNITNI